MKRSLSKTLGSILLTVVMCLSTCFVASAAEYDESHKLSATTASTDNVEVVPQAIGTYDMQEVPARGEVTLHTTLYSYVGLTRTFYFSTDNIYSDKVPAGKIRVWVSKPNGDLLKYFTVNARDDYEFKCTLPSSGTYTVDVQSEVNERILCSAGWTA